MPVNFNIPNAAGYLPRISQQPMGDPALSDEPLNPGAPGAFSPLQLQVLQRAVSTINEEPPVAPPRKKHSKFVQGMINADPYFSQVSQRNYETTPQYQEYARKEAGYQARQKALGPEAAMVAGMARAENRPRKGMQMRELVTTDTDPVTGGPRHLPVIFDPNPDSVMPLTTMDGRPVDIPPGGYIAPIPMTPYATEGGGTGFAPGTYVGGMGMPQPGGQMPQPRFGSIAQNPPVQQPTVGGPPPIPGQGPPGTTFGTNPAAAPPVTQGGSRGQIPANLGGQVVRPSGNRLPGRAAPPGLTEQAIRQSKMVSGLHNILSAYDDAHAAQVARFGESGAGLMGQMGQDYMSQSKYGRAFVQRYGDPAVQDYYNKIRLALYDYVKAQTGAQFSITEMDRYLASFPTTIDDPETAHQLIQQHVQRAVNEINTLKLNWPSIRVQNEEVYVDPNYMQEFIGAGGGGAATQPQGGSPFFQQWLQKRGHRVIPNG